jgi:3-oxoadipate enol-lactonase
MGLSLGGMTALGLGLTAPERVNRVICCAARADAPLAFVQNWRNRLAILESGGIEDVWESTVGFWFGDETRRSHPEREVTLRNSFLKTTEEGYRGCANALIDLDYLRHLGGMTVPTLFLAGANDTVAPPDTMRAMANACPGSAFSVVPEAKHIMNLDRPDNFVVALLGFLGLDPN